jgi:invasion protein IalB
VLAAAFVAGVRPDKRNSMILRLLIALIAGTFLVWSGANYSVAQNNEKKAPVKAAPKKKEAPAEKKKAPEKKEAPKAEQKKAAVPAPNLIAQYGDWGVYVNKTAKTCFALTQPKDRQPGNVKRDPAYFFVTTRQSEKLSNEISIMTGFTLKEDADVVLAAGGKNFAMFAKGAGLWVKEPAEEPKLLDALKNEKELTLKLTPAKGQVTTDRYSLAGLPQALERVAKECP